MTTPRRSLATPAAKRPAKMDIGDEVIAEVNQMRYLGVLRHLGPVHFRPGVFAGLELIGDSAGKGKNDGSVDGQQYFACDQGDGMFCPAVKVKPTGAAPSSEATARPQSAMSGRSSVSNDLNRPGSSLANAESETHFRPRSSLASGRTPSRSSVGRPSSAMATPTPSARLPRLLPRKSVADGLADEEGRRRAKTSAEEAAKAEGRITEGSRAHRFLNMSAKDLEARRLRTSIGGPYSMRTTSPEKSAHIATMSNINSTSPLKESLLGSNRTPKLRSSMGSSLPTPAAGTKTPTAFRSAMRSNHAPPVTPRFSKVRPSTSDMPPPQPSAQKPNVYPRTPSRLSVDGTGRRSAASNRSVAEKADEDDDVKRRNHTLLEQLDLLTPRHMPSDLPDEQAVSEIGMDNTAIAMAEAMVPLSVFEELSSETNDLKVQVAELQRKLSTELDRAKVQAQEGIRREMEEERRVEREDDQRRRKDELQSVTEGYESKQLKWKQLESELREQAEASSREFKRQHDELEGKRKEYETYKAETELRLSEKQKLIEELKAASTDSGTAQAKELEMQQLTQRIERMEEERSSLLKEIDELKDAGQETIDIYEREQAMRDERIDELEQNMHLLEARAQEAIGDAIRERDEALERIASHGTAEFSSVAAIDRQSLADQLEQAQKRNESLEDQLNELTSIFHQEREAHVKRKDGYGEREAKLKAEVSRYKSLHVAAEQHTRETKQRLEEMELALEQSRSTLETERAELESLRAEAMIMGDTSDVTSRKALEMNGLRSIVNTLNQELAHVKKRERELRKQVEDYQNDRKRWSQSSANSGSLRNGSTMLSAAVATDQIADRGALEANLRDAEAHVQELENRLAEAEKSKRDEIAKLNQDIVELEALCEATVWRREEQEAQRQELERKIGKLQRQMQKMQSVPELPTAAKNGIDVHIVPPASTTAEEDVFAVQKAGKEEPQSAQTSTAPCAECNEHGHVIDDCPFLNDDVLF